VRLLRTVNVTRGFAATALGLSSLLAACGGEAFSRGDSVIAVNQIPANAKRSQGFPSEGCLGPVQSSRSLAETRALMAEGARPRVQPQDAGWQPVSLSDVAVSRSFLAVVDRQAPSVSLLTHDYRRLWTRDSRGAGPGELSVPTRVKVHEPTGAVWILDQGRRRLLRFDSLGVFQSDLEIPNDASDFAITAGGRVLVTHMTVVANAEGERTLVSEYRPSGQPTALLTRPSEQLVPPEYVLRGPNRPRITAFGDTVALIYQAAGVVTLYRLEPQRLILLRSIATCMPAALQAAYDQQRSGRETGQTSVDLIGDITIRADTLLTIGSRPDAQGRYGIQRFSLQTGANLGSVALDPGPIRLPQEVRLHLLPANTILAMDPVTGYLATLAVK